MATILTTKIQLRNDTKANWEQYNPTLLAGEIGVCNDNGLFKIGDGEHTWNELAYANDHSALGNYASHYEGTAEAIPETDPVEYESNEQVIARVMGETVPVQDDIFIVKRLIGGESYSYTAFVYNGSNWAAMDGNYNADNVYFDSDLTVTAPIGVVTIPDSGSTKIEATGKNLTNVLASILAERKLPTATKPSVTVKFTNEIKALEVGDTITPTYQASLSAGKYTYGPATGITAKTWSVVDSNGVTRDTAEGSFPELEVVDSMSYSLTATATYDAGAMPVDNLGEDAPSKQIAAGSDDGTTSTKITGYRNYFYGFLTTSSTDEPLTSAVIRDNLIAGGNYNEAKEHILTASEHEGAKRIVVAYPADTTRGGLEGAIITSSLNYDALGNGDYKKIANVDVEGKDGYQAKAYTVYVYEPASLDPAEVHKINLA